MSTQEKSLSTFISSFTLLFYVSKFFGITAYSIRHYYKYKIFKISLIGILFSLISTSYHVFEYHFLSTSILISDQGTDKFKKGTLGTGIAIVLNYIGPIEMCFDTIIYLINSKKIIKLFDRFKIIDEHLKKYGIFIDNNKLKNRISILICILFLCELCNFTLAFLTFFNFDYIKNWLLVLSNIPFLIHGIDKIWFTSFLYALRQRFQDTNNYLDELINDMMYKGQRSQQTHNNNDNYWNNIQTLLLNVTDNTATTKNIDDDNFNINMGYLHKEIKLHNTTFKIVPSDIKRNSRIIPVLPWNEYSKKPPAFKDSVLNDDVQKIQTKLIIICQLHDEFCEIGKAINAMWSLQMLILMAHGFVSITAKFYFFYCSIVDQYVPNLFRPASNIYIVCFSIAYISARCIYIIYLSWKTKIESRRTGICFHKFGLVINENKFYEAINHLSLKLLNHSVDFTACGFFSLDMTTLYAVTGAITSYLIILIQFNLATYHQKMYSTTTTAIATTINN